MTVIVLGTLLLAARCSGYGEGETQDRPTSQPLPDRIALPPTDPAAAPAPQKAAGSKPQADACSPPLEDDNDMPC
jgi:hypothetical protein